MWLFLAFSSAVLLGFYDVFKKQVLKTRAVLPVLTLNTLFCSLLFLPFVLFSATGYIAEGSMFYVPASGWAEQRYILLKAVIVLASWLCGYYGIKHLPLTIVGPINATRPVMVLLGALLFFGERLNLCQWVGVLLAIVSFFLLSRSGRKEGIDFRHDRWIFLVVLAAVLGALSGLYDRYLLAPVRTGGVGLSRMLVQSYYNLYQFAMMGVILWVMNRQRQRAGKPDELNDLTPDAASSASTSHFPQRITRITRILHFPFFTFHFSFLIFLVSLFLSVADFAYFYALSLPDALISVVSMIRRASVLISFSVGAFVFHEKNLRTKAFDLALVLLGMVFLYLGSK